MKKLIFFFLLLLLFPVLADTDRATLRIGQSLLFDGYNFTVINLSPITDSAVFCVNDQKVIFVEDKVKTIDVGVSIDVIKVSSSEVRLEINVQDDRECGNECRNVKCFVECKVNSDCDDEINETIDSCVSGECRNNIVEETEIKEEPSEVQEEEVMEEQETDSNLVIVILISAVVILGLLVFLLKK